MLACSSYVVLHGSCLTVVLCRAFALVLEALMRREHACSQHRYVIDRHECTAYAVCQVSLHSCDLAGEADEVHCTSFTASTSASPKVSACDAFLKLL